MSPADLEQGSQAWKDARLGHATASRISDVMAKPRSKGQGEATTRKNYRAELVAELLSGKPTEGFENWQMRRGRELEPLARAEYELRRDVMVDQVGFIVHPRIPRFGASPDGIIGNEGLVQFKAPTTAIHLEYLMKGVVPSEYRQQMLAELSVYPQRKWNDFVSYEPNLPPHLRLFIVRLPRNEAEIAEIEAEVIKFNAEVDDIISKLPRAETESERRAAEVNTGEQAF